MRTRLFRSFAVFSLVLTLTAALLAQQPATQTDRLREHVVYLASDTLEGRRTGTAGAKLAAEYIAKEFSRYGLRRSNGVDLPGMSILEADSPRRYMQDFPYVAGVELGTKNVLSMQGEAKDGGVSRYSFVVGEDWMPLGFSPNAKLDTSAIEFVGYGITAAELKHDDYANGKARGKVAVALSGTPDGDNPHGQFVSYEGPRWKAIAAKNAGAVALIIVAREEKFKDDRLSELRYDNSSGDAGIPVLAISQQTAVRLLGARDFAALSSLAKEASPASALDATAVRNTLWRISIDVQRKEVSAANVIGILDGSDPKLKNEVIVIGAHYDHLGHGGEGSLAPRSVKFLGLMTMRQAQLDCSSWRECSPHKSRKTVVFIAFSGEEEGLLGSNYYVNHPLFPLANTVAMINMDMIGE